MESGRDVLTVDEKTYLLISYMKILNYLSTKIANVNIGVYRYFVDDSNHENVLEDMKIFGLNDEFSVNFPTLMKKILENHPYYRSDGNRVVNESDTNIFIPLRFIQENIISLWKYIEDNYNYQYLQIIAPINFYIETKTNPSRYSVEPLCRAGFDRITNPFINRGQPFTLGNLVKDEVEVTYGFNIGNISCDNENIKIIIKHLFINHFYPKLRNFPNFERIRFEVIDNYIQSISVINEANLDKYVKSFEETYLN